MTRKELTITRARAAAFDPKDEAIWDGDFLAQAIAMQSYRSLRRFITQHVAPRADARIRKLFRYGFYDRAQKLLRDERALDAWAVGLWSEDLEVHAHARHWYRWAYAFGRDSEPWLVLKRDSLEMEFKVKAPDGCLGVGQAEWMLGHATLAILRHRFARARSLALGMARANVAELEGDMVGRSILAMKGEVLDDGDLQFVVDADVAWNVLLPRLSRTKDERRRAAQDLQHQRQESLKRLCIGLCLRFTWRDGWGVASATVPDLDAGVTIKRNRLFAEGRPQFILFATSTGYCARMVDAPLEVLDEHPWKAIDTLRHAYGRYKRQQCQGVPAAVVPAKPPTEAAESVEIADEVVDVRPVYKPKSLWRRFAMGQL